MNSLIHLVRNILKEKKPKFRVLFTFHECFLPPNKKKVYKSSLKAWPVYTDFCRAIQVRDKNRKCKLAAISNSVRFVAAISQIFRTCSNHARLYKLVYLFPVFILLLFSQSFAAKTKCKCEPLYGYRRLRFRRIFLTKSSLLCRKVSVTFVNCRFNLRDRRFIVGIVATSISSDISIQIS